MVTFARTLVRGFQLLGTPRWWRWALLVVLAIGVAGFEALGAFLVYLLLSLMTASGPQGPPLDDRILVMLGNPAHEQLQLLAAGMVGAFFVIRAGVVVAQRYIQERVVLNEGARLATSLLDGYLASPYREFVTRNSSTLVRNAFDSVQVLAKEVFKPAVEVMAETVLLCGLTVLLLVVAPRATLIVVLVMWPMIWLLLKLVQPRLKLLGRRSQAARGGALRALQEALGGFREIRLATRESVFVQRFRQERRAMARAEYVKSALSELPRAMIETTLILAIAAVFVVAVLVDEGGGEVMASLGVLAYAGLRLQPSLRHIVQGLNHVRFGAAVIDDLLEDRQWTMEMTVTPTSESPPEPEAPFQSTIELRDVSFQYVDGPVVLDRVSLTVDKGQFLGVCGPTGGGKSTLIDVMVGLMPPSRGAVFVDGAPLPAHPRWWYRQIGLVSQDLFLMDDTIRRNIAFGDLEGDIDEDRLDRAIDVAQLTPVIRQLPDGMKTVVGERGVRLSGGQKQRVAVARALYRDPPVIVFDEGTSALDRATEVALVGALETVRGGRTLICVAHRISTLRDADRILIVEAGRITADGTHDELQRTNSTFRSLAQ